MSVTLIVFHMPLELPISLKMKISLQVYSVTFTFGECLTTLSAKMQL